MGVEGVFPHLEEQEVPTPRVDMANVRGVHVDVLGVYYSYIKSTHQRLTYNAFRQEPNGAQHATIKSRMAMCLHNKLSKTFTQSRDTVLHIGGPPTSQKARARETRKIRNAKDLLEVENLSENIRKIVAAANTTSGSKRRTQRRKLLRLNRKLKKCWGLARIIDAGMKADFTAGLEELGWKVCRCQGEEDVCIGRRADEHPGQVVVASCDSDMLFHGVKELLRKERGADVYTSYSVADVIQRLQVNEAQWVVAGVVTNNDYAGHVRGQSFKKNLAVLRECDAVDKQDLLQQYCTKMGVSSTRFDSATDIFFKRLETPETDTASSGGTDDDMKEMVNIVTKYLKQTRTDKAHEAAGPQDRGAGQESTIAGSVTASKDKSIERSAPRRTSGNEYRAKEFTQPVFSADDEPYPTKRKAQKQLAKKRKKLKQARKLRQKVKRDRASKRARREQDVQDAGILKKHRKRNPGNMVSDVLKSTHHVVTLNVGTVDHRLQVGLNKNYGCSSQGVHQHIISTLRDIVKLNTELLRCGVMAVFNFINTVISDNPSINTNSSDIAARREIFQFIAYDKHGYFGTLVKALYHGEDDIRGHGPSFGAAVRTVKMFKAMPGDKSRLIQRIGSFLDHSAPSHILEQVGQTLGDMVRCHIRAFVSELRKRVATWSPQWAATQDGSALLETINDRGVSPNHDPVSLFWILNTILPVAKRLAYLPMPGFKDNFCVVSEKHLMEAVLRSGCSKATRDSVVELFGQSTAAQEMTQSHSGELFRRLFFHGKQTNYDRHAGVANPINKAIPHLLDLETLPCQEELESLEHEDASSATYKKAKEDVKAAIKEHVLALDGATRTCKYVLTGTIHTDGHQLKIHAHSLVHPREKPEASTSSASPTSSTRSKMDYLPVVIPDPEALESEFGDQDSHIVLAIDPGIKQTATAVIVDSIVPGKAWNLSFAKGSHTLSSHRHARMLERCKKERRYGGEGTTSINDLELKLLPMQPMQPTDGGGELGPRLKDVRKSYYEYAQSVFEVEQDLRSFYGSRGLKVARYRKDEGEKAEVGRAIGGMMKAVRARSVIEERRPLVVIGDGDFKGRGGGAVKSNKFVSQLKSTAIGEGMVVCCVDEFRTSISCCICHKRVQTKGRSVICPDPTCGGLRPPDYDAVHMLDPKAGLHRDRDHNAGQNMANAALQWVREFKWPEALNRQVAKQQQAPCGAVQTHMDFGL